jgi:hypothetical protein
VTSIVVLVAGGCGGGGPDITFDAGYPTTIVPSSGSPLSTTTTIADDSSPWVDATGNLAGMASECGNMSQLTARPGTDEVIASVARQGLWVNTPASDQWTRIDTAGPQITHRAATFVFDPDSATQYWVSGPYGDAGVFRTNDARTFQPLGGLQGVDGVSVDLTDPLRQTLLVGSHERADLYRSTDGGTTFTNVGPGLPPDIGFVSQPLVFDRQLHLVGTYATGSAGIFRTEDGGLTWQRVFEGGIAGPPLVARDASIYWLIENGGGVVRSEDDGATWTVVTGPGVVKSYNLVELADGRLATLGGDGVVVSDDDGRSWRPVGDPLPMANPFGLTYSQSRNAVFVWMSDCGEVVLPRSVQRLDLGPPPP